MGDGCMAYLPPDESIRNIMDEMGIASVDEIPRKFLPNKYIRGFKIRIPTFEDEYSLLKYFKEYAEMNKVYDPENIYVGLGVEPVYVPSVVKYLISRGEFLTSYTPYQPEMSQGVLQALYEYQSIMSELVDMDVVNSSMYDGASAIGEALLMSERIKRRGRVLIPSEMFTNYKKVVSTYLSGPKIEIVEYEYQQDGSLDLNYIEEELRRGVSGVYVDFPNFYGYFYEDIFELEKLIHEYDSLMIIGFDVWSLPIVIPPGKLNADIAVGEGQPLGIQMGFGGPLLGIFAVKGEATLIRNMPGRLIGETITKNEERAYTMILQTREQHIRREKATSNICTNEALTAIQTLMFILYYGKRGLYEIALRMLKLSHRLKDMFEKYGFEPWGGSTFHRRFTVQFRGKDPYIFYKYMAGNDILPGYPIDNKFIIHFNMMNSDSSVEKYIDSFERWVEYAQA